MYAGLERIEGEAPRGRERRMTEPNDPKADAPGPADAPSPAEAPTEPVPVAWTDPVAAPTTRAAGDINRRPATPFAGRAGLPATPVPPTHWEKPRPHRGPRGLPQAGSTSGSGAASRRL